MTTVRPARSEAVVLTALLALLPRVVLAQPSVGTSATTEVPTKSAEPVADTTAPPLATEPPLPESGFELGIGTGFAMPLGDADSGASLFDSGGQSPNTGISIRDGKMSGIVAYRVHLLLDLGYRLDRTWWLGLRPEAGTGGFGSECPTQANCNWTDARVGVLAKHHFAPTSFTDPWLGLNLGWEWMRSTASVLLPPEVTGLSSSQAVSAKQTISGPILELLGGLNFDFGQHIHAGPFLSAALGRYFRSSFDCSTAALGCPAPSWIEDGAFHAWLSIGISGTHGP